MTEIRPTASDLHIGGKNLSISMLNRWWTCPREWYWSYLHPLSTELAGIEPHYTSSPLLIGSGVHIGLQAYYESGWEDGGYDVEAATTAARTAMKARSSEYESEERYALDVAEVVRLLLHYDTNYGPASRVPEWETFRPARPSDLGRTGTSPYIETTFSINLKSGYSLTVRPDMLGVNYGMLVAVDHKTPGASRVAATVAQASMGAQGMSFAAVLRAFDVPNAGYLSNIIIKGDYRSGKYTSPKNSYQRHVVGYDPHLIDQFLELVDRSAADIAQAVAKWHALREDGLAVTEAMRHAFPMAGVLNGQCHRFNRPCDMFGLCSAPGREDATIANYSPRTYKDSGVQVRPEGGEE